MGERWKSSVDECKFVGRMVLSVGVEFKFDWG